jgi:cbb3-type cytochrome oxidase subunit 3
MKNKNLLWITLIITLCFILCIYIYVENGKFFFF